MGLKPKTKGHTYFYECCDLTKTVYLIRSTSSDRGELSFSEQGAARHLCCLTVLDDRGFFKMTTHIA